MPEWRPEWGQQQPEARMASRGGMAAALVVQVLTPVVEAFEQLGIAYCVGGSVASSHYGAPRETHDVDLIAEVRLPHVEPLVAWLQHEYFSDAEMIADALRD